MRLPVSISAGRDDGQRAALPRCCARRRRNASAAAARWRRRRRSAPCRMTAPRCCRRGRGRVIESSRITTSRPCSTRRLAFSITISATATWREAGSSKVEETTSPFTERCMSVTSSGRSSISSTIRKHSGVIRRDGMRDVLQQHRLAGARWRYDQRALALADRRHDVDDARREVLLGRVLVFHAQPLVRIERREVVEIDLCGRAFSGSSKLIVLTLSSAKYRSPLLGAADLAFDRVAGAQAEAADLRGRDVDVVGAGQVVGFRRAQEAEAVLQAPRRRLRR